MFPVRHKEMTCERRSAHTANQMIATPRRLDGGIQGRTIDRHEPSSGYSLSLLFSSRAGG